MVVVAWVMNYRRKILAGLVAGTVFLIVIFLAPAMVQTVFFGLIGVGVLLELSWQAVRRARQLSSWLLVLALMALIFTSLGGALRLVEDPRGSWYMFAIACIVSTTDVVAQYTGQRYGTPGTFLPSLSPSKTLHGVYGGIVSGMVVACVFALFLGGVTWCVLPLLPALAIAGDLLESATKRSLGIKDFASYIPQTGGLLDRVDSWLPALALTGWLLV